MTFNSQITSPQQAAEELALNRGAHDLRLLGAGVEFLFFSTRAGTRREGYRVPRARVFDTVNNPGIQALELQRKELRLSAWALVHGVPSANPTELVDQGGYSVLVTEVIDDDQTPVNQQALGAVLAKMHQVEPLASEVARCPDIYDYLAQRIGDRHSRISTDHQLPALPKPTHLAKVLQRSLHRVSQLHLDIRRQNIRVAAGEPRALFDWSNALTAAPELEMARIREYAQIPENALDYMDILAGYRAYGGTIDESTTAWAVLRLDAALMLAGVFTSVSPNEELASVFLNRVRILLQDL